MFYNQMIACVRAGGGPVGKQRYHVLPRVMIRRDHDQPGAYIYRDLEGTASNVYFHFHTTLGIVNWKVSVWTLP